MQQLTGLYPPESSRRSPRVLMERLWERHISWLGLLTSQERGRFVGVELR